MKINKIISKNILFVFILVIGIFTTGCQEVSQLEKLKSISKILGVDISGGTLVLSLDNHGGFLGDGTTFIKIKFTDNICIQQIQKSNVWHTLPFTENLMAFLDSASFLLSDDAGNPRIPTIENGYYCFFDRHPESKNSRDDSELMHRYSYNITLALYDADANILYYLEIDT